MIVNLISTSVMSRRYVQTTASASMILGPTLANASQDSMEIAAARTLTSASRSLACTVTVQTPTEITPATVCQVSPERVVN